MAQRDEILFGRHHDRAKDEGGDAARLGETTRSLCVDDIMRVCVCVLCWGEMRVKEREQISQGYVSWVDGITIVVGPQMQPGYKFVVLQRQRHFGYHLPLSFAAGFLSMEEEETLKRLDNFDLDFDLFEVSIDNTRFNTLLLLWRGHHDGICLDVIVGPRAD